MFHGRKEIIMSAKIVVGNSVFLWLHNVVAAVGAVVWLRSGSTAVRTEVGKSRTVQVGEKVVPEVGCFVEAVDLLRVLAVGPVQVVVGASQHVSGVFEEVNDVVDTVVKADCVVVAAVLPEVAGKPGKAVNPVDGVEDQANNQMGRPFNVQEPPEVGQLEVVEE
jgi:hypothetical protein